MMFRFIKTNIIAIGLLFVLILFQTGQTTGFIPSNMALFESVKDMYQSMPFLWLSIGALTSTVVFINIYVPGPIVIFAAILASDGSVSDFVVIATVTTCVALIASLISHYWGVYTSFNQIKPSIRSWIIGHCSLYTLGYWYYRTEMDSMQLIRIVFSSAVFLFPYSILICYLLYPLQNAISEYTNIYIIAGVLVYLVFNYTYHYVFLKT